MNNIIRKGKLIVIDGADAAGKETTAKLLVGKLNSSGILGKNKAHFLTFPNYSGPFGTILKELYLSGKMGNLAEVDPLAPSILYAADRALEAHKIYSILQRGDWIICDRYVQSNFAYQGVRIENKDKRDEFIDLLQTIEYEHLALPVPDTTIILTLSNRIRFMRSAERGEEDIHEKNKKYMEEVATEYLRLAEVFGWHIVDCAPEGEQFSREGILDLVWQVIYQEEKVLYSGG